MLTLFFFLSLAFCISCEASFLDFGDQNGSGIGNNGLGTGGFYSMIRSSNNGLIFKSYGLGIGAKLNWHQALEECARHGMTLASVNTEKQSSDLNAFIARNGKSADGFWLSGSNLARLSSWVWFSTGRGMTFTNWGDEIPSSEDVCMVLEDGLWIEGVCADDENYYVCEELCQ